jgi:hypothetical protein
MIAIRVRMPALDWALVSKLTFMVILLSQDGGRDRLLLLIGLAVLIYLFQTGALGPLRRYVESLSSQLWARMQMQTLVPATGESGARPVPRNSSSASGRDASFEAAATSRQEPLSTRVLRFLRGLYLVIIAFVCSLIPTWRPPPRRWTAWSRIEKNMCVFRAASGVEYLAALQASSLPYEARTT